MQDEAPLEPIALVSWLASLPPNERDRAIEARLGILEGAASTPPGSELVGYHPSGVAPIVTALLEAAVDENDVFVDLGAGLGKAVFLASILTGARARGIELQPALVEKARAAGARLRLSVAFSVEDARTANLDDGTVFFLYLPFTGHALGTVVDRLGAVAARRAIVVCALGVDLPPRPWLTRRRLDSFWLNIYDGRGDDAPTRVRTSRRPSRGLSAIAREVALDEV